MFVKTPAVVLRETNYKDADKILTVLTAQEGKRTVLARAARRKGSKYAACTQFLVYSEMTLFSYRDHFSLEEAATLEEFRTVRAELEGLSLCAYFAEVMELVAEEGRSDPALLSLLLNAAYALNTLHKPRALVKAAFELRLMCLAGYAPTLEACADCALEEPLEPVLDLDEGLLLCRAHAPGKARTAALDAQVLAAMRHVVYGDPKRLFSFRLDAPSMARMGSACERFLLAQLDRGFKTLDYYHSVETDGGA